MKEIRHTLLHFFQDNPEPNSVGGGVGPHIFKQGSAGIHLNACASSGLITGVIISITKINIILKFNQAILENQPCTQTQILS